MSRNKKTYSADFKAKVAVELLNDEKHLFEKSEKSSKDKYISFSCVNCKSQITQLKNSSTLYCPECNDIDLFEEELYLKDKKESVSFEKIDFSTFPKNIYKSKIYSNVNELLEEAKLYMLDISDIEDFNIRFKNEKINFLSLDLKSFNEIDINLFKNKDVVVHFHVFDNKVAMFHIVRDVLYNFMNKLSKKKINCCVKDANINKVNLYYT